MGVGIRLRWKVKFTLRPFYCASYELQDSRQWRREKKPLQTGVQPPPLPPAVTLPITSMFEERSWKFNYNFAFLLNPPCLAADVVDCCTQTCVRLCTCVPVYLSAPKATDILYWDKIFCHFIFGKGSHLRFLPFVTDTVFLQRSVLPYPTSMLGVSVKVTYLAGTVEFVEA